MSLLYDSKNKISLCLSGGGNRAYSVALGMLNFLKRSDIIKRISMISGVSGSSWITTIAAHTDLEFDDIKLLEIPQNLNPIFPLFSLLWESGNEMADSNTNRYILSKVNLDNKKPSDIFLRKDWPLYIIGTCYVDENNKCRQIHFMKDKTIVNDRIIYEEKTITTMISSSSYIVGILPSLFSYEVIIEDKVYNCHDGGFIDNMGITPLLQNKDKKIIAIMMVSSDGNNGVEIIDLLGLDINIYDKIFNKDDWNEVLEIIKKNVQKRELCIIRKHMRVINSSQYNITEYTPEIIFYILSQVTEFEETPWFIENCTNENRKSELNDFPNFSLFFQNGFGVLSYTNLQTMALFKLGEWVFSKIYETNNDFFKEY